MGQDRFPLLTARPPSAVHERSKVRASVVRTAPRADACGGGGYAVRIRLLYQQNPCAVRANSAVLFLPPAVEAFVAAPCHRASLRESGRDCAGDGRISGSTSDLGGIW
jgi:hypothetical protein